jgi:hypothetical protein
VASNRHPVGWVVKQWRLEQLERLLADDALESLSSARAGAEREARRLRRATERTARDAERELVALEELGAELAGMVRRRRAAVRSSRPGRAVPCSAPPPAVRHPAQLDARPVAAGDGPPHDRPLSSLPISATDRRAGRRAAAEPPLGAPAEPPLAARPATAVAMSRLPSEEDMRRARARRDRDAAPVPLPIPRPSSAATDLPVPIPISAARDGELRRPDAGPRRAGRASLRASGLAELFRVTDARPARPQAEA